MSECGIWELGDGFQELPCPGARRDGGKAEVRKNCNTEREIRRFDCPRGHDTACRRIIRGPYEDCGVGLDPHPLKIARFTPGPCPAALAINAKDDDPMLYLSEKYSEAVDYAAMAHAEQLRKGTTIPYISHPIAVSALVIEHGGNEVQAIAGLLHDVLEDCGPGHAPKIARRFGLDVLRIVEGLTDGVPDASGEKPEWRERKETYLAHLKNADLDIVLVSACDKLHNATAIADDHAEIGGEVFERFSRPKSDTIWYYRELERIFSSRLGKDHRLTGRLNAALKRWAS